MFQDVVAHAGTVIEVTLPQYLDGIWTHRHLQVTHTFAVKSRESKQVRTEIREPSAPWPTSGSVTVAWSAHCMSCVCVCGWMWLWMLQVFEGGWGCKTELVLSGCHICTSAQEHRKIVEDMCRHINGMLLGCSCYLLSIGSRNVHIVANAL